MNSDNEVTGLYNSSPGKIAGAGRDITKTGDGIAPGTSTSERIAKHVELVSRAEDANDLNHRVVVGNDTLYPVQAPMHRLIAWTVKSNDQNIHHGVKARIAY